MKKTTSFSAVALVAVMALVTAASVSAANVPATVTVSAGTLSLATSAAPSMAVTLDGTDQTPTYTLPMTVSDARGSGAGWNVTITSTTFSTGGASALSTSASQVTAVSSSCASGTTCTAPTNSITYPLTVPAGATAPTAVKLFNSAVNTGLGGFTITPTVGVSVPANTATGTYTSTVTIAVVSGP
jgi:WxL domain surface cell wall-binding